ncbi:MAG TPA: redoxin domain-containing protein [Desulfarculaceae bacterium]|nr:redoxin domain-containing protein [Desulfarculaceae bacterium]
MGAPYLLLEIFGTQCSHCIAQAPIMNNLFNLVQQDAKLSKKIKFLSVGAGDNKFAVTMFGKFYKVPFPLLPDPDTKITKKVDILGTPTTLLLNKKGKVIELHVGAIESAEGFFKKLKAHVK